eukprot:SAG31_NODE_21356_length_551_cov_3.103982_1_plen_53_part_10
MHAILFTAHNYLVPYVLNLVRYKAPEKQRPVGAAGAFGTGDTGGRYSTGTVLV